MGVTQTEPLHRPAAAPSPTRLTSSQLSRNLAVLWIAEFTAIFGFTLSFPFLPLFLKQVLGIADPHNLAAWTAIVASVTEFSLAICGPGWGFLADRFGRKPMLVRAMVGGGLSLALMGFSRSPVQLTIARALEGATSGTVTMASAIVGGQTPRSQMARSMGILGSAVALGGATGPVAGGLLASQLGLRATFLFGCFFLLLPIPIVIRFVVESRARNRGHSGWARAAKVSAAALFGPRNGRLVPPLVALLAAQFLTQATFGSTEQLLALRILDLDSRGAAATTGLAFGVAGVATALAGATYSRGIRAFGGYASVATLAALMMAIAIFFLGLSPSKVPAIAAFAAVGLVYGVIQPTLASMVSLGASSEVQGRVFGISAGAIGVGLGAGPLIGAFAAAFTGVQASLLGTAVVRLVLAGVLRFLSTEPADA